MPDTILRASWAPRYLWTSPWCETYKVLLLTDTDTEAQRQCTAFLRAFINVRWNAVCSQTPSSKATQGVWMLHPQYLLSMFFDSKIHWPPGLQGVLSLCDAHSLGRGNRCKLLQCCCPGADTEILGGKRGPAISHQRPKLRKSSECRSFISMGGSKGYGVRWQGLRMPTQGV